MNRILVTGACGQIGSEFVPELRNKYGRNFIDHKGTNIAPDRSKPV